MGHSVPNSTPFPLHISNSFEFCWLVEPTAVHKKPKGKPGIVKSPPSYTSLKLRNLPDCRLICSTLQACNLACSYQNLTVFYLLNACKTF